MNATGKPVWLSDAGDREIIGALSFALSATHCGVTVQERNLDYRYIYNLPDFWSQFDQLRPNDASIYGPQLGEKLALAKEALVATGEQQNYSTMIGEAVISFSIDLLQNPSQPALVVTTIHDITQVRKREAILRTLLLELSHRSKNLMAIIQGLASQSAKYAPSLDAFLKTFTGRLHAVSGAQDVLVDSNWQGASLFALARRQLVLADADADTKLQLEGDDVELDPNQSLHIGLALHELAMLAAMPTENAKVPRNISLAVETSKVGDQDHVRLVWQSSPGINGLLQPDFGSVLLEKVVPAAISGEVANTLTEDKLNWTLTFPLRTEQKSKK